MSDDTRVMAYSYRAYFFSILSFSFGNRLVDFYNLDLKTSKITYQKKY